MLKVLMDAAAFQPRNGAQDLKAFGSKSLFYFEKFLICALPSLISPFYFAAQHSTVRGWRLTSQPLSLRRREWSQSSASPGQDLGAVGWSPPSLLWQSALPLARLSASSAGA